MVDRLIRDVTANRRRLTDEFLVRVRRHLITRSMDQRLVPVAGDVRRLSGEWNGQPLFDLHQLQLAEIHLIRRVIKEQQWPSGTTLDEYLADLYHVILTGGEVFTYTYEGQAYIGFLASTRARGPRAEALTWVAYSASYGVIRTGYQVSSAEEIFRQGFPPDWLRQR